MHMKRGIKHAILDLPTLELGLKSFIRVSTRIKRCMTSDFFLTPPPRYDFLPHLTHVITFWALKFVQCPRFISPLKGIDCQSNNCCFFIQTFIPLKNMFIATVTSSHTMKPYVALLFHFQKVQKSTFQSLHYSKC